MDPPLPPPPLLADPLEDGASGLFRFDPETQSAPGCPEFRGLCLIPDFLSTEEASDLVTAIERSPYSLAQSGKRKQHYGAKVNFNKRRLNTTAFRGLPGYAKPLEAALRSQFNERMRIAAGPAMNSFRSCESALGCFRTTDLFVLEYQEQNASNLDFHIDDIFAYGEMIIVISLESDSVMTFIHRSDDRDPNRLVHCVRVPLAVGSVAFLHGPARHEWEHAILSHDIRGRRISITLRTLSDELRSSTQGQHVLAMAKRNLA